MKTIIFLLLWLPLTVFAQGAQPMPQDPVANKRAVELAEENRGLILRIWNEHHG